MSGALGANGSAEEMADDASGIYGPDQRQQHRYRARDGAPSALGAWG